MSDKRAGPVAGEIAGPHSGYWIEPEDDVPLFRPAFEATGMILVAREPNDDNTHHALSLVHRVDGSRGGFTYVPVSETTRLSYFHTTGMTDGDTWWRFAIYDGARLATVYECFPPLEPAHPATIERDFGPGVARRTCEEDPPLVFRIVRRTPAKVRRGCRTTISVPRSRAAALEIYRAEIDIVRFWVSARSHAEALGVAVMAAGGLPFAAAPTAIHGELELENASVEVRRAELGECATISVFDEDSGQRLTLQLLHGKSTGPQLLACSEW